MHVVAGTVKGRKLNSLTGLGTRPTSGKVKEGIFSAIQFDIIDAVVLDLYAGSGQMGIEALSRGAKSAVFIDFDRKNLEVIKTNLKNTGFIKVAKVATMDVKQYVMGIKEMFDIAILDPPYNMGEDLFTILPELSKYMSERALIVCETITEIDLPDDIGNDIRIYKTYRYGKTKVTIYGKEV